MKNKLHQSLTVLMAFLILLSSMGFAVIEHQCMMRGKSVKFVSEKKTDSSVKQVVSSCCAKSKLVKESKGTYFKKTDCCKENQKFEKVNVASSLSQLFAHALKVMWGGVLWSTRSFVFLVSEWILPSSGHNSKVISFSSLFHGRTLRSFIQSFLI